MIIKSSNGIHLEKYPLPKMGFIFLTGLSGTATGNMIRKEFEIIYYH